MYIFKYHPDGQVLHKGKAVKFSDFIAANPGFPITEGEFFEYGEEEFCRINEHGHHLPAGGAKYQPLINAIHNLGE